MTNARSLLVGACAVAGALLLPLVGRQAFADEGTEAEAAARADLNALYKGDYRAAFVSKNPELFARHISPELQFVSYDGSSGGAEDLKGFVAARIESIERVLDHRVTIEHVQVDAGLITAVVTLTTVLDLRSPTGTVYRETSIGTYRDQFTKQPDGSLLEVRAELMRSHTNIAPTP
jgi:hypothetical protein